MKFISVMVLIKAVKNLNYILTQKISGSGGVENMQFKFVIQLSHPLHTIKNDYFFQTLKRGN